MRVPVQPKPTTSPAAKTPSPQAILNGEVHDWHRIILGYSDHLVSGLIKDFELKAGDRVLDPFCGTGTTLVECMKHGVDSFGIDANPASVFAARVKTSWNLKPERLLELLDDVERSYSKIVRDRTSLKNDPTHKYIVDSGMLKRGWISDSPLIKAVAIKKAIHSLPTAQLYKNCLLLALISEVVHSSSNVKFGPELYCADSKDDAEVLKGFARRIKTIAVDISIVSELSAGSAQVTYGDARNRGTVLSLTKKQFKAVICSPPYPAEHDYTRNSRLELAFLEEVVDLESLREIKKLMIRSHTKGIYKSDEDAKLVARSRKIQRLGKKIDKRAEDKSHGFARLYGTVVRHYFGGMRRHFRAIQTRLIKGALCAYVVGDQSSYLRVHIPTAEVLGRLAELEGFKVVDIRHWRGRRSSTTSKYIDENVLILSKG